MSTDSPVEAALTTAKVDLDSALRSRVMNAVEAAQPDDTPAYHLAQMNIARFRSTMDDPDMAGFVEMLDPINHQAEAAPGFVWRLTGEGNNATDIVFYDDPLMLVNMSVWTDIPSLRNYVYRTEHADMVKRREGWADALESTYLVLWWVPVGHVPDIAEGDAKLRELETNGPTADAFTFGRAFDPPVVPPD